MLNYLSRICFINAHVLLWTYFSLHLWREVSVLLLHSSFAYHHHPLVGDEMMFSLVLTLMSISEPSWLSGSWTHCLVLMTPTSLTSNLFSHALVLFAQEQPLSSGLALVLAWVVSLAALYPAQSLAWPCLTCPGHHPQPNSAHHPW